MSKMSIFRSTLFRPRWS